MKILMVYFSATGNTAKIGRVISERLCELGAEVDERDITSLGDRKESIDMEPYDAVVFGQPVHSLRTPRVVRDWMRTLRGGGKKSAMFFTYGGFKVHPCHESTRQILAEQGFAVVSSAEFLGAHTFNLGGWKAMVGRPDASDFQVAETYAGKMYDRFTGKDPGILNELEKTDFTEEQLDSFELMRFKVLEQLPTRYGEDCSMCMLCEETCPTGAISAETGETEKAACIACLRCINDCPENVLKINDTSAIWNKKLEMDQTTAEELNQKKSKMYL
jgi:ferredoxin/flavodoxin